MPEQCLFCRMVRGEIPATLVAENAGAIAIRDINPQAPVHVLVIPRTHVESLNALADGAVLGAMGVLARDVAMAEGMADRGWRAVMNTGSDGGQTVLHLHMHVMGGRSMHWPPG